VTARLQVPWPDPWLFEQRLGRTYRILALADEVDRSLESVETRRGLGPIDLIVGCGDLPVDYLRFVTDAFETAPLAYVRGNHDVSGDWATGDATGIHLPDPLLDGQPWTDGQVTAVGFSGIPRHGGSGLQVGSVTRFQQVVGAWLRLRGRPEGRPFMVISHVAPRGINDGPDRVHRGSRGLRWLADRARPRLWLHGHTTLVTRRFEDRCIRRGPTLYYNAFGANVVELVPTEESGLADPNRRAA
jgi:uncharacterized protein